MVNNCSIVTNELSSVINSYHSNKYDNLSHELSDTDTRIKFEEWLLNSFSPDKAKNTDFAWHSKIIGLICTKKTEDLKESDTNNNIEDHFIAELISHATPGPKENENFVDKIIHRIAVIVHRLTGRTLDFSNIFWEIKNTNLPSTCTVLLERMLEHQDFHEIVDQAMSQHNMPMLDALFHHSPQKFKAAMRLEIKTVIRLY